MSSLYKEEEDTYKKTHIKKTLWQGPAKNIVGGENFDKAEGKDGFKRVQRDLRESIFRKRLFEVYDNLNKIKPIGEVVKEGAYRAAKEVIINRSAYLFKNNIRIKPEEIAEIIRGEFPYDKIPPDYEKARDFFVAAICNLTARKITQLLTL